MNARSAITAAIIDAHDTPCPECQGDPRCPNCGGCGYLDGADDARTLEDLARVSGAEMTRERIAA